MKVLSRGLDNGNLLVGAPLTPCSTGISNSLLIVNYIEVREHALAAEVLSIGILDVIYAAVGNVIR